VNGRISRDFFWHEFTDSQEASRLGITVTVPPELQANAVRLFMDLVQPFRDFIKTPLIISSGYRPPWLNYSIGGAKNSRHMQALAIDGKAVGMTPLELCQAMVISRLPFDQCIYEYGAWMHCGVAPAGEQPRGQVMWVVYEDGVPTYRAGLPKT
jgi:hypothetical protein